MRVLVTGHLGYIGSVMVPMLLKEGYDVVGMDSDLYRRCTFGERPVPVPMISKDIRDADSSDFENIDVVFHLAALSNDPLGNLNPDLTFDINHRGTVHLADKAKKAGVKRFIFSSSCSNYGAAGNDMVSETSALDPITPYGVSKVKSEQDLTRLATDSFTPVFLRNATAYGFSPRHRFDIVLNNLAAWATTTGRVFLKGDGTAWRPLIHVEDICRAFMAVSLAPKEIVHNQAFNIVPPEANYRISEIAEIVKATVPDCRIEYADDAGPDKRCYRVSSQKIFEHIPAFKPTWTPEDGAKEVYKAYQQHELTLDEFEGVKYRRVDHIKMLRSTGLLDGSLRWTSAAKSETSGSEAKQDENA